MKKGSFPPAFSCCSGSYACTLRCFSALQSSKASSSSCSHSPRAVLVLHKGRHSSELG